MIENPVETMTPPTVTTPNPFSPMSLHFTPELQIMLSCLFGTDLSKMTLLFLYFSFSFSENEIQNLLFQPKS